MDESSFYAIVLLGCTALIIYSILKEAVIKSVNSSKPDPPVPFNVPVSPEPRPLLNPQPVQQFPVTPAPPVQPQFFPSPFQPGGYPGQPVMYPPPGGNGHRQIDPAKIAEIVAIYDEIERRRRWIGNY